MSEHNQANFEAKIEADISIEPKGLDARCVSAKPYPPNWSACPFRSRRHATKAEWLTRANTPP